MIRLLTIDEYNIYLDHVKLNLFNSREHDSLLLEKIINGLTSDKRIKIFAKFNDDGTIAQSMLTKKREAAAEYYIVNYRTSRESYFSKKSFLRMFAAVFEYYEELGYYRWLTSRKIDLFSNYFDGISQCSPFDRYETAIEYAPMIQQNKNFTYHSELLDGIPDESMINEYIIITGYCKQVYRKKFNGINFK